MVDKQGRLTISSELLSKANISMNIQVQIFFDRKKRVLLVLPEKEYSYEEDIYYIKTIPLDKQGRLAIPNQIRNAFPDADYLPSERNGNIYIHIIEH